MDGCGGQAVVWRLSEVVCCWIRGHVLSGGCPVVAWAWTRKVGRTRAADRVGGVSVTVAITGAVRWAAGLWRGAVVW